MRDKPEYRVHTCLNCKGRFLMPQPEDSFLRELYSRSYYDAWGIQEDTAAVREMKISTFIFRLKTIHRYKRSGNILDVGCATGFFLEAASMLGFKPFGVEFSDYSAKVAQSKFGNDAIFEGTLEECQFPDGSFDVIAMSDLLEHVRNPHDVLEKTRRLLKDDGIVMVMTPDTGSLTHRIMQGKWVHYKIEHLFYFNKESIAALAGLHGFEVIRREPARKTLNLAYFYHQFKVYPHWLLTPCLKLIHSLLPEKLLRFNFNVTIGEMVVVLKKSNH